jgi:hypothetical protein
MLARKRLQLTVPFTEVADPGFPIDRNRILPPDLYLRMHKVLGQGPPLWAARSPTRNSATFSRPWPLVARHIIAKVYRRLKNG